MPEEYTVADKLDSLTAGGGGLSMNKNNCLVSPNIKVNKMQTKKFLWSFYIPHHTTAGGIASPLLLWHEFLSLTRHKQNYVQSDQILGGKHTSIISFLYLIFLLKIFSLIFYYCPLSSMGNNYLLGAVIPTNTRANSETFQPMRERQGNMSANESLGQHPYVLGRKRRLILWDK